MGVVVPKAKRRQIFIEFQIGMHQLEDVERVFCLRMLDYFEWNRTQAALSLGISPRTLARKLRKWGKHDYRIADKYKSMMRLEE